MKVFISHQQQDTALAERIALRLRIVHSIPSYLDVMDDSVRDGLRLAEHLRKTMRTCTHLLAVVSSATQKSWWVPWEIGVASERDLPLATYSTDGANLPSFLRKWPYLINESHLDAYAAATKSSARVAVTESQTARKAEDFAVTASTSAFYRELRQSIGQ